MVAVDRARARVDHPRGAGVARREEHVEEAVDVAVVRAQRLVDGARHAPKARLVQHHVDRVARGRAGVERPDVALDEAEAPPARLAHGLAHERKVLALAGREVVEAHHLLVEPQQLLDEVRADEAGRSGDQPGAPACPNALARFFVGCHVVSISFRA
jgi:hypothetical protein